MVSALGCQKNSEQKKTAKSLTAPSAGATSQPVATPDSDHEAPSGAIEGTITLEDGSTLPAYPPEQMRRQVLNLTEPEPMPEGCSPASDDDRRPVQVSGAGLSGVMVAVTGFSRYSKRAPLTHEVVLSNCRLHPMLVVAAKDDLLRLRSEIDYPFMPSLGDNPVVEALIKGQEKIVPLNQAGPRALLCGFTAPCGRTDIVVINHSLYAVTGEGGRFRIDKVPAGEVLTVNAWHPLFEAAGLKLSVQKDEVRNVSVSIKPLAQYTRPPAKTPPVKAQRERASRKPRRDDPTVLR
jgi:hypothetical protein